MLMNPTNERLKIYINEEKKFIFDSCFSILRKYNNIDIIKIVSKNVIYYVQLFLVIVMNF